MLRGVLPIFAVFVTVDCSLLKFGLVSVDNKTLPTTAVTSTKQATSECACRKQCTRDENCTGVTTFETESGTFGCDFSTTPYRNSSTLVKDISRPLASTLLKVAEKTFPTTTSTTKTLPPITTTSPTTTKTPTTTTTPNPCATATPSAANQALALNWGRVTGLSGYFFIDYLKVTFDKARVTCAVSSEKKLASLSGPGELASMQIYLQCRSNVQDAYWVDLTRDTTNNTVFKWGNEIVLDQTAPWAGNDEPNHSETKNCVVLMKNGNSFGLATKECNDKNYIICRI